MLFTRHTLVAIAVAATLAISACNSSQTNSMADRAPTAGMTSAPAASANRLSADQVDVQMTLQETPTLSKDGHFIDIPVHLVNHGKATLASTGPNPVNLGAHSATGDGVIVDYELARAAIPNITQDGQATVTIKLPLEKMIGKSAQILPVQENVAWFDAWGTKPLLVGPFNKCPTSAMTKICGIDGKPLAFSEAK